MTIETTHHLKCEFSGCTETTEMEEGDVMPDDWLRLVEPSDDGTYVDRHYCPWHARIVKGTGDPKGWLVLPFWDDLSDHPSRLQLNGRSYVQICGEVWNSRRCRLRPGHGGKFHYSIVADADGLAHTSQWLTQAAIDDDRRKHEAWFLG